MLQLLRRHPRYLTYGFLHYFFSAVGQTFFVSLFVVAVTARLGWGDKTFAGVYSAATLAAAFSLPFIGTLVDRLRIRYVSTAAALALILACGVLATTRNFYVFALALFVARLGGQGVLPLIGSTTIGRFFVTGRGKALSLAIVGISLAEVVLPPVAVAVMAAYGYRWMWLGMAGLLALVFIPAVWLLIKRFDAFQRGDTVEESVREEQEVPLTSWTRREVLGDRRFRLLIPVFIFLPFVFTGLVFNQSVIAGVRGYSPELMAWGLSTFGLLRVICLLGAGPLVDRFGAASLLRFAYLPLILGLAVLAVLSAGQAVPIFFALGGMTAGIESVLMPALWAERYGPRYLGSIKSTVRLLVVLAAAAAPIVFSYGLDFGLSTWLLALVGYGLLCILLLSVERKVIPSA